MKDKDLLRMRQIEELAAPYRQVLSGRRPQKGWIRAIQEGLGMTNVQLAKRLKLQPQTVEDMQGYEISGTIKLKTLEKLAYAMGCRLAYAIVPPKPLEEMRNERAYTIAKRQLQPVSHSMKLEDQGVTDAEEQSAIDRLAKEILAGNPKQLWQ